MMKALATALVVRFQFVRLEPDYGALGPRLRLHVGMRSEHQRLLTLLNVVGQCLLVWGASGEYKVGNFGLETLPVLLPAETPRSQPGPLTLVMDLDEQMIRRIEEFRNGGDLLLRIVLYTLWASVDGTSGNFVEPVSDAQSVTDRDQSQTISVPQTVWLKILEGLRYGKYTVFEIETPAPPLNDVLAEAIEHLTQANRLFHEGNYEESMIRCRRAIESAVDKIKRKSGRQLSDILGSDSRAQLISGLATKTNKFLAPTAHSGEESRPPEPKNREDARLANIMAYAAVAYVASFLTKEKS